MRQAVCASTPAASTDPEKDCKSGKCTSHGSDETGSFRHILKRIQCKPYFCYCKIDAGVVK